MSALGVVTGDAVADFELGLGEARANPDVEHFGFEVAVKGYGVSRNELVVVVAIASLIPALHGVMPGKQFFESGGRVLVALVEMPDKPSRGPAHCQVPAKRLAD